MKKFIIALVLMFSVTGFSQTLTYDQVSTLDSKIKGEFSEYVSKDGKVFKVGDSLTIGKPYESKNSGKAIEIKKILIGGNKRSGYFALVETTTPGKVFRYTILLEKALESGELVSK